MSHTVMVTGADGFIGSHLAEELVKSGEKVRAFCLYNSFGSLGWIDTLPPEIRNEMDIFMGDVRDPNGVRTAMRGQERVFHLAALIAIPFSYHSPDSYVDTNIKGTLNVLNAARELGTQRVMVTSTSEVYGTAQYVPIDEHHPFQGQSPGPAPLKYQDPPVSGLQSMEKRNHRYRSPRHRHQHKLCQMRRRNHSD